MGKSLLFFIVPFCSIFILVGGGLMFAVGRKIVLGVQASHWPHTSGRVLSVESKDTSDSDSSSREIKVRYSYNVDGQTFENDTIHPSYESASIEQAHRGLESILEPGRIVRVYYDAKQPGRSTLATGFYTGSLAQFFGGFIFFGAGVGFLLTFLFAIIGDWDFARGIKVLE